MDFNQLAELNKSFAEQAEVLNNEFIALFEKWFKKDPRLALVMAIHLPIALIMNLYQKFEMIPQLVPDLPDVFFRAAKPFYDLREKWGKIAPEEFEKEYRKLFEAHFDEWFPTAEEKEKFKEWYETNKKSK